MAGLTSQAHHFCCCDNPVSGYLQKTLLGDKEVLQKIFETSKETKVECSATPVSKSIMYHGGTIRPMIDGSISKVGAIGFHNGKVEATGTYFHVQGQMEKLGVAYDNKKLLDGQTLLPGLIEPHVHIAGSVMMTGWKDWGPFDGQYLRTGYNTDWLKEKIQKAVKNAKPGNWVLGYRVDPSLMPFIVNKNPDKLNELETFDVTKVDELSNVPDKLPTPVMMISASMHTAYVNTAALKAIWHCPSTPKVREDWNDFADYWSHVNERRGLQEVEELTQAIEAIPKDQFNDLKLDGYKGYKKSVDEMIEIANKRGVTLLYDAAMTSEAECFLREYFETKKPTIRIGYAQLCTPENQDEFVEKLRPYEEPSELDLDFYKGSVKFISDGSNQGLTGYQCKPYRCLPANNYGEFNYPEFSESEEPPYELFNKLVKAVNDKGWPIMIHANGDKAIGLVLETYKYALNYVKKSGLKTRHRIEHCSILDSDDITLEEMSYYGISPSFLIGHVGYWGYAFRYAIFEEKAELLDRSSSALGKGMQVTFHSDYLVSPMGPLRMMEQAITRIMEGDPEWPMTKIKNEGAPDNLVLNKDEALTAHQALRAITYNAAWQCHADNFVGSLAKGKLADYIILAEDPITRENPIGMRDIKVLETWVGGVKVYEHSLL